MRNKGVSGREVIIAKKLGKQLCLKWSVSHMHTGLTDILPADATNQSWYLHFLSLERG